MYYTFQVEIPKDTGKISINKRGETSYVEYTYDRKYNPEKKYNVPKRTTIGKLSDSDPDMMYPNPNFLKYFPDYELPEELNSSNRSSCIRVGAWMVLRKLIQESGIDGMLDRIIGNDSGLFLDLAAYSILTENNASQYYPDYAYNHPLFTDKMRIYSDSKVSAFLSSLSSESSVEFLNSWNESRDHREKIYISYDSTNKTCQAGDIELCEFGHSKDGVDKPIINYSIAYDRTNNEPLFYEGYPGSIVDVAQLQHMLNKAKGYGYRNVGFILDRGYFGQENIHFMDKTGYDFVIMMKGMKALVSGLIDECHGTFEEDRKRSIRSYKVSGTTVKRKLFVSDTKDRYFHVYFSEFKRSSEREALESRIDVFKKTLEKYYGTAYEMDSNLRKYFDPVYYHEGKEDQKFMLAIEKTEAISKMISRCGYFVIITSRNMTAEEALELYKSRDSSEKLFRGDKAYLGNRALRVCSNEALESKIFIEFAALIIRNRMYVLLKEEMKRNDKKSNYMTVPAAIRELEKIEMIRTADGVYRLDHALTLTQKSILKAFGIDAKYVKEKTREIGDKLRYIMEVEE